MCDMDEMEWSPDPAVMLDLRVYADEASRAGEQILIGSRGVTWEEFLVEVENGATPFARNFYLHYREEFQKRSKLADFLRT